MNDNKYQSSMQLEIHNLYLSLIMWFQVAEEWANQLCTMVVNDLISGNCSSDLGMV